MQFIITQKEIERMLEISKEHNSNLIVDIISTPILDSKHVRVQGECLSIIDITDWESA